MFRISTEEIYYFIMELFLFSNKYLFLVKCGKQLVSNRIKKVKTKELVSRKRYPGEGTENKKASSIRIILNETGLYI